MTVKLGGRRNNNGNGFYELGSNGWWWSSTPYSSNNAWCRYLTSEAVGTALNQNNNQRSNGFSVRCLRNLKEVPFKIRDDGLEMKDDGAVKDLQGYKMNSSYFIGHTAGITRSYGFGE